MVRIFALGFLWLAFGSIPSASPQSASWPQFRGPDGTGVADGGTYATEFGEQQNLLWKAPVPRGVSSPCIWEERIFINSFDRAAQKLETICLSRRDGEILWRRPVAAKKIESVHRVSSPASATPATDGERVFVYFCSYGLLCYDLEGDLIWERPLPLLTSRFGSGTSPVVVGNTVFLNRDQGGGLLSFFGGGKSELLALNATTGQERWKASRRASNVAYTSPTLIRYDDREELVVLSPGQLIAYDAATGKQRWQLGGIPLQTCASPVFGNGRLYVSATGPFGEPDNYIGLPEYQAFLKEHDQNDDAVLQISELPKDMVIVDRRATGGAGNSPLGQFMSGFDRNRDKNISQAEWDNFSSQLSSVLQAAPVLMSISLDELNGASRPKIAWKQTRGVAEVPTPLLYQGRLYTIRNGGIVHCWNAETGAELFRGRIGATGGFYASPVAGDGKVYLASDRGVIVVLAAGDRLEVLAKNELGEPIVATPALVDDTIYVRTEAHLYAFKEFQK